MIQGIGGGGCGLEVEVAGLFGVMGGGGAGCMWPLEAASSKRSKQHHPVPPKTQPNAPLRL